MLKFFSEYLALKYQLSGYLRVRLMDSEGGGYRKDHSSSNFIVLHRSFELSGCEKCFGIKRGVALRKKHLMLLE